MIVLTMYLYQECAHIFAHCAPIAMILYILLLFIVISAKILFNALIITHYCPILHILLAMPTNACDITRSPKYRPPSSDASNIIQCFQYPYYCPGHPVPLISLTCLPTFTYAYLEDAILSIMVLFIPEIPELLANQRLASD